MKSILIAVLFLSVSAAFAGQINAIECSGVPKWVQFKLKLDYNKGTFYGDGTENYVNLKFDCKNSASLKTIVCESSNGETVSAIITIDKDDIVTAKYSGVLYRNIKIGCIARM